MTSEEQDRLIDELLKGCKGPDDILGKHGLLKKMNARFMERALAGELTEHLGYAPHERAEEPRANSRNGSTPKTLITDSGAVEIKVPRDRDGSFEPVLIPKGQRRLEGFDEKVIALYARGLTTREIQAHLEELYGVEVSPTLISAVTAEVTEEVRAWQARRLEPLYPIIYFDALFVRTRQDGPASQRAVYPRTSVQLCVVHKVRNSLRLVPWKQRKTVASDLRSIYAAATLDQAQAALESFALRWDEHYPLISRSWRKDWEALTTFFDHPPALRKVLYTTNAIESLNYSLRRVLKNRGAFPDDASVTKVLHLAITRAAKKWTRPIHNWADVVNRFVIMYGERMIIE